MSSDGVPVSKLMHAFKNSARVKRHLSATNIRRLEQYAVDYLPRKISSVADVSSHVPKLIEIAVGGKVSFFKRLILVSMVKNQIKHYLSRYVASKKKSKK